MDFPRVAKSIEHWPGTPVAKTDPPDAPWVKKSTNPFDQFDANPPLAVDPEPAFNPDKYLAFKANEDIKLAIRASVIGVAATGAISGAMLVFFAGLGWVIAGFARD